MTAGMTTIRRVLTTAMRPIAEAGAQVGIVSEQYVALRRGEPVTLSREQLESFYITATHRPDVPDLTTATSWQLTGDSTLTPNE